jgi:hypothetical protein
MLKDVSYDAEQITGCFIESSYDSVVKKLSHLSYKDMEQQVAIVII